MSLWTPAAITTALWLDADDASTITTQTGVSEWRTKSGGSNHAAQSTAGSQPSIVSNGLNSKTVLRFANAASQTLVGAAPVFPGATQSSAFIVYVPRSTSGTFSVFGQTSGTTTNTWREFEFRTVGAVGDPYLATYAGDLTDSAAITTAAKLAAFSYDGTTLSLFKNGSRIAYGARSLNTVNVVYRVGSNLYGQYADMDLAEIVVVNGSPDTTINQKIEGYLAWKWGLVSSLPSDHPYKNSAPTVAGTAWIYRELTQPYIINIGDVLETASLQQYGITIDVESSLTQFYSMLFEIWMTQIYGDVPEILSILSQPYASAPTVNKSLSQPWADALALSASLEQPWTMPGELAAISEQRYGIAAAVLLKTSEQLYHINANTTLFANLSQPYAIAAEAAQLYYVDTKLFVAGVATPYLSVEWQDGDEYALSCELTLAGQDIAARCVDGVEIRIDSAGESWFFQCVGGWRLDKRFASEVYHVSGLSRTCALDEGPRLLGDIASGMASQIVTDLAAPYGITVDWQMADGYLPPGKISAADETALAIIGKIVWDAKGKIMSTRDGNLLIVCEEETPVPEWPTVTPAATIVARLERVSTSEQHDKQPGYNRFVVSDQTAAGGNFNLEYQEVDPYTKEVRLFITPIDGRAFYLITSGGAPATIEPFGVTVLPVVDELVEFKEGTGNTQRPIYGINAMSWLRDDLGATVSFTEAGILTAEVAGYSLLKISYESRYHKWLGRDQNIETVQFIAHEVKTT